MGGLFSSAKATPYLALDDDPLLEALLPAPPPPSPSSQPPPDSIVLLHPNVVPRYDTVVFCGGGVKGMAHLGAVAPLQHTLPGVTMWAGASAGAILAALFAAGMAYNDAYDLLMKTDTNTFLDRPGFMGGAAWAVDGFDLVAHVGMNTGAAFYDWLGAQLGWVAGDADVTFGQIAERRRVDLRVVATDVVGKCPFVFSPSTTPDTPVRIAVRASMSIPYVFQPVKFRDKVLVDGGTIDNLPIDIVDPANSTTKTLALRLDATLPFGHAETRRDVESLTGFSHALLDAMQTQASASRVNMTVQTSQPNITLLDIPVPDIPITTFAITTQTKYDLWQAGKAATERALCSSGTKGQRVSK